MAGKSEDFDKALKLALCCIGKGDFTLKAEQLDAIKCICDGKDVSPWLPTGFGKSICYETQPFVFNCKHSDGRRWNRCHSGSDPPENPIRAGSDMLAVSILPQRIRSGVSTGAIGFLLLTSHSKL